jgi:predicted phage terminase large subunit-like protein
MRTTQPMGVAEYQAFERQDLHTFVHRTFRELNPRSPYLHNWHNELIASKLEACQNGKINRLIVNVPPRSLKSHAAAVAFPSWVLGLNPSAQIICASYGQDLANKHSSDCRSIMTSRWYSSLFSTRLARHKQSVQEFLTTQNGFRLATSVGGVLTGRGADFIIIDDPLKPEEALSETQRQAVNEWYDHTLYSRLNDKQTGCIIIIMQRLHEDDLVGHVLEQEHWDHVRLPAIAEEDETHVIESRYQTRTVRRRAGEALHPQREPLPILGLVRRTLGEYNFAGQYQQSPSPLGGGMVKAEWFKYYVPGQQPSRFDRVFQSWDTANKCTELSDFSVCTTWGQRRKRFYLLNVLRQRLEYPHLKRAVRAHAELFKPSNILIEDKASGTQLIQDLIHDGVYGIARYEPTMDKVMRLHSVTSTIENGFVYLPSEAHWLAAYLHELTTFPNGKHDDQADSTSQALDWAKQFSFPWPLFEYWRREAIRNDWGVDPSLLYDDDPFENVPAVCSKCGNDGPAQYNRGFHCNQCGHEWKDIRYWSNDPDIQRCQLPGGETLHWDEGRGFWVDLVNGDTYPPGEEPSAK